MLVALDFETSSLNYWEPDFKVYSVALAWRLPNGTIKTEFVQSQNQIRETLEQFELLSQSVLVYNAQFEIGVLRSVFGIQLVNWYDVMMMGQLYDSGGPTKEFGLKAVTARNLPHCSGYEQPIYDWIRKNIPDVKKGKEGQYLGQAPYNLLREYNVADAQNTLLLYEKFCLDFENINFDWGTYNYTYRKAVDLLVDAKIRGLRVDSEMLKRYSQQIDIEVANLDTAFFLLHQKEIEKVRESLRVQLQSRFKKKIITELPEFNITSKAHLKRLFVDELKQIPKFHTPKGAPSFKASHLGQWAGAEPIQNRGKRLLVKSQVEKLVEKSERDGRFHADIMAVGTNTGRYRGGGGLNIQAIARRDQGLMSAIQVDSGNMFVGIDCIAGEPTVTCHYTKSARYQYFVLDGVGKMPFWQNGILMLDDIYLAYASSTRMGAPLVIDAWNRKWENGRSFSEQWLTDPEPIKKSLKKTRQLHKTLALALAYGMGYNPNPTTGKSTFQEACRSSGFDLSLDECREFYESYWGLFPEIKNFADYCASLCKKNNGRMINEFGFTGITEPRKAFNWVIQSTLSSVLHEFCCLLLEEAPWAQYELCIHDELIFQVPENRVEELKKAKQRAEKRLNEEILNWSVPVRTGWAVGFNLYDCK